MSAFSPHRANNRRTPRLSAFATSVWSLLLAACGGGGGGGGPVASAPVASAPVDPEPVDPKPEPVDQAPLLYLANQAFRFDRATQISPLRVLIFEHHPTDKPLTLLPSLKSLILPFGIADNNLFRLEDGKLVFRAPPDFEAPTDTGNGGRQAGDSEYHIRLVGLDQDSRPVIVPVVVRVLDLPNEKVGRYNSRSDYSFTARPERESDLPAMPENKPGDSQSVAALLQQYPLAEVAKIIWGYHWVMPKTGPLVLTWSLTVSGIIAGMPVSDQDVQKMRKRVEQALLKYEHVVDIQFVEVDEFDGRTGHIEFLVFSDTLRPHSHTVTLGRANAPGQKVRVDIYDNDGLSTVIHEIGHALGLKHPFASKWTNWPFDPSVIAEPWSVMNYYHRMEELRPFDVAALRYLYGSPGANGGIARPSGPVPSPGQNVQPLVNQRPTAFTISDSAKTLPPGVYYDLVLATIHIIDDGLGLAFPVLVGDGSVGFRLEQKHDHWQLKPPAFFRESNGEQVHFTIRLVANGIGPDTTPDLTFTLTAQPPIAGAPHDIRIDTSDEGRSHIRENTPISKRLKIADLQVEDALDRPVRNMQFVLRGDDAGLFEIVDNVLYLRAGVKLDYEEDPSLDVVVSVRGTELAKYFSLSVGDVRESQGDEPILTGVHKVGAQLAVSTPHNSWSVIENVEWTRQGEDEVLSDIELFRADAPGNYQVTVTYWVRNIIFNVKQPSKTWTRTISIAPPGDAETAGGSAAPRRAFDPEEPYDTGQGEEAASSPLPDIV